MAGELGGHDRRLDDASPVSGTCPATMGVEEKNDPATVRDYRQTFPGKVRCIRHKLGFENLQS